MVRSGEVSNHLHTCSLVFVPCQSMIDELERGEGRSGSEIGKRERESKTLTDRKTYGQTDTEKGRDRQTDARAGRRTDGQAGRKAGNRQRHTDRQRQK